MMKGSENQVKWAQDIKNKMDLSVDGIAPRGQEIIVWVNQIDDATWWIDNRDLKTSQDVLMALMDGTFIDGKLHVLNGQTGQISKKWSEIVSDGSGHKKEHETVVF